MKPITRVLFALSLAGAACAPAFSNGMDAAPTVFAPGVISGAEHDSAPAFSPDGKTVWFTRSDAAWSTILESHYGQGQWSTPQTASFSGRWRDMEPALAPGGEYHGVTDQDKSPPFMAASISARVRSGANCWMKW